MAREEVKTELDRKNKNNLNRMFTELYGRTEESNEPSDFDNFITNYFTTDNEDWGVK